MLNLNKEQIVKSNKGEIKLLSILSNDFSGANIIEVKELKKIIDGKELFSSVNFDIPKGSITVITGKSGAGKTTISRIINGIEEFDAGEIFIDNVKITKRNKNKLLKNTAFVFQNFNLFPNMSVLKNIIYTPIYVYKQSKDIIIKKADELLKKFNMEDYKDAFPHQLSGGQKQRIAIIRALIIQPKVLIMDEPTASLDPELSKDVADIIKDINKQGLTIIVVSHDTLFVNDVLNRN